MNSVKTTKTAPPGRSTAQWRQGYQADVIRTYPMGPGASPLTNNYKKRKTSASNSGGASVGGGT